MRSPLVSVALLLSACTTQVQVTGPYAAKLSVADVQQLKLLAANGPKIGRTVITLEAIRPDRVHVEDRLYSDAGWRGSRFFAVRHVSTWQIDEHSPIEATDARKITVY